MTSVSELKSKTAHLPPIDENVNIPAAIRAASQRASELHNAVYNTADDAGEDDAAKEAAAQEAAAKAQEKADEDARKQEEAEAAKKESATAGKEPTPSTPEDWEHKYNSMKGRYDRSEETIRGLNSRIGQLENLLAAATTKPREQQPTPDLKFGKLTDKDREDFGEDFLDAASRAAEEKLGPYIAKLEDRIRQLGGSVENVATATAQSARERMYAHLDDNMPNWREINKDPKFVAWCNLRDPYSGAIRIDMMKDAHAKSDGTRVLEFFRGFLKDEAASDPAGGKPEPLKTPGEGKSKVPLSEFAAPGRAKAPAATVVPGEKETISQAQIAAFYRDVNKGKYRGNEAEKNRLEAEIFQAQAEGRVV